MTLITRKANKRGSARLASVQALYQMDISGKGVHETIKEYKAFRLGKNIDGDQYLSADVQWFYSIVIGVVKEQKNIDPIIGNNLPEFWSLSRIDSIIRAILRAGFWELKNKRDVPVAVIVSEYIDIAKAFFFLEEPKLINALLDRLAKKVRTR